MYQAMPAFLRETGYRSPRDATSTVFQAAWNEKRHVFSWLANQPEKRQTFDTYMALRRGESEGWCREWCDVVGKWATNQDPHRAVFVDVGGSGGHRCSMFKRNLPNTPGRVVLQDLTTDNATAIAGVDIVTHDFFKEQPAECRGQSKETERCGAYAYDRKARNCIIWALSCIIIQMRTLAES